ncbi:MAG: hypothetical protein WCE21_04535 [Candidatus Babeliales bacterium]
MDYKKTIAGSLFFIPAFSLAHSPFLDSLAGSALGSMVGTVLTNNCSPQRVYLVERPVIHTTVIKKKRPSFIETQLKAENTRLKVANDVLLEELCKQEEIIEQQKEQIQAHTEQQVGTTKGIIKK